MTKYQVLVVDDDIDIQEAIEIYLKGEGMEVSKANNGLEALRYAGGKGHPSDHPRYYDAADGRDSGDIQDQRELQCPDPDAFRQNGGYGQNPGP